MIDILKISLISFIFCALGQKGMIFEWYQDLINRLPEWLCRPLGGCSICFSGQFGLWYYLFYRFETYNFIEHLFFISATIFCSMIYRKIWLYLRNES